MGLLIQQRLGRRRNWSHPCFYTNCAAHELRQRGKVLKVNAGEVPEAAVCQFHLPYLCPPLFAYFQQLKML